MYTCSEGAITIYYVTYKAISVSLLHRNLVDLTVVPNPLSAKGARDPASRHRPLRSLCIPGFSRNFCVLRPRSRSAAVLLATQSYN